jgi:hypothetical protein
VLGGRDEVESWLAKHPNAAAISYQKPWSADLVEHHAYAQPYRGRAMLVSFGSEVAK